MRPTRTGTSQDTRPAFARMICCTGSTRPAGGAQRAVSDRAPWDWRMLVNGHGDEMLYERGMIDTSLPLAELKQRSLVNARAQAAGAGADYSQAIRQGLPAIEP